MCVSVCLWVYWKRRREERRYISNTPYGVKRPHGRVILTWTLNQKNILPVWPWANVLTSLSITALIYKMGIIIALLQGHCKNATEWYTQNTQSNTWCIRDVHDHQGAGAKPSLPHKSHPHSLFNPQCHFPLVVCLLTPTGPRRAQSEKWAWQGVEKFICAFSSISKKFFQLWQERVVKTMGNSDQSGLTSTRKPLPTHCLPLWCYIKSKQKQLPTDLANSIGVFSI